MPACTQGYQIAWVKFKVREEGIRAHVVNIKPLVVPAHLTHRFFKQMSMHDLRPVRRTLDGRMIAARIDAAATSLLEARAKAEYPGVSRDRCDAIGCGFVALCHRQDATSR